MFSTVVYLFMFIACLQEVICIRTYNFKDQCEHGIGPIEIPNGEGENQMLLTYYSSNPLKPNTTCVISVFNPDLTHPPSVIAHFISFSTDYSKGCLYSRMDIYDGIDANPNKAFTGTDGVCGSKSNVALYYNSTSQYMAFRFKDEHARSTFRILLTSAHTGRCYDNEFGCSNGLCIRQSLVCNGYNNCGNNLDEFTCIVALAAGTIVAIVFGALVGVICIPMVIVCLVCRSRRPRRMMYRQI